MSAQVADGKQKSKKAQRKTLFWLTEAQAALSWGVILALIALVGAIYLYQTSRIAGVGRQVQYLQNDLDELKRDNARLEREIAESQSLEFLQEEAVRLGFVRSQPDDVEYIVIPEYPQAKSLTPTPEATPLPEPAESLSEALWLTMQDTISDLIRGESP